MLLLAGGCQRLFSLRHVGGDDASADGPRTDTGLDTGSGSGNPQPVCPDPQLRTDSGVALAASIDAVTVSEDRTLAIGISSGSVVTIDLSSGLATSVSGIAGAMWSSPGLSPDGTQLLLANADSYVWHSSNTGSAGSWGAPMHEPGFALAVKPGTMGKAADGTLRVVVTEGTVFREYAYDGASWTMSQETSSAVDLSGSGVSTISDPALTSDAMTLVFVVTNGAGGTSVHYVRRGETSLSSKFQMAGSPGAGTIVTAPGLATPYLGDDCTLFVIQSGELIRYAP